MKRLLYLVLLFVFCFSPISNGMKPDVRNAKIVTIKNFSGLNDELSVTETYFYDKKGKILQRDLKRANKSGLTEIYDEKELITKITYFEEDGEITVFINERDFENKIGKTYRNGKLDSESILGDFGKKVVENFSDGKVHTREYDLYGNPLRREFYRNGKCTLRLDYQYDEKSKLCEALSNDYDGVILRIKYSYDPKGQIILIKKTFELEGQNHMELSHDPQGKLILIKKTFEPEGRNEMGFSQQYIYKEYDSYGNWIKRKIYVKGKLVDFETREIRYYE